MFKNLIFKIYYDLFVVSKHEHQRYIQDISQISYKIRLKNILKRLEAKRDFTKRIL